MYKEGTIIYFNPFYFRNGQTPKPKYFVVLKNLEEKIILAVLPTSKVKIPYNEIIENGCLDLPDINLTCYVFAANVPITECNNSFSVKTHIYGYQLSDYTLLELKETYKIEGEDFSIFGQMKENFLALSKFL